MNDQDQEIVKMLQKLTPEQRAEFFREFDADFEEKAEAAVAEAFRELMEKRSSTTH